MDFLHIFLLAILQGLTEFLPISSSAHLILIPKLAGWIDQGLSFDVAVHVGTLSAVIVYFRKELKLMSREWMRSFHTQQQTAESILAWGVIIGTIPVGLTGFLFKDFIETYLRSPLVIAITTIGFGLLLYWADQRGKRVRDEYTLSLKDIIFIGCAQALALIPGTSRSGITITAGLMLGLTRAGAARFSFLLSIPAILLPGLLLGIDVFKSPDPFEWSVVIQGAVISGLTAFIVIHYFLKLLERIGMTPYVIYRILLGTYILVLFY